MPVPNPSTNLPGRNAIERERAADCLAQFRRRLLDGTWRPGTRLPSERELAELTDAGRRAVRWALDALAREGHLRNPSPRIREVTPLPPPSAMPSTPTVLLISGFADAQIQRPANAAYLTEQLFLGVVLAAHKRGVGIVTTNAANFLAMAPAEIAMRYPVGVAALEDGGVAGCVDRLDFLARQGIPVAAHADVLPSTTLEGRLFDRVSSDHAQGMRELVKSLAARGCRRVLRLCDRPGLLSDRVTPDWWTRRQDGYGEGCRQAGLTPLPCVEMPGSIDADDRTAFDRHVRATVGFLLDPLKGGQGKDALCTISDRQAFVVAAACRLLGRVPGRDVWIAGYDNYWPLCAEREWVPDRPITTVDKGNRDIGAALLDLLFERRRGLFNSSGQVRLLPQRLVYP